jgi:hypothetical protein
LSTEERIDLEFRPDIGSASDFSSNEGDEAAADCAIRSSADINVVKGSPILKLIPYVRNVRESKNIGARIYSALMWMRKGGSSSLGMGSQKVQAHSRELVTEANSLTWLTEWIQAGQCRTSSGCSSEALFE